MSILRRRLSSILRRHSFAVYQSLALGTVTAGGLISQVGTFTPVLIVCDWLMNSPSCPPFLSSCPPELPCRSALVPVLWSSAELESGIIEHGQQYISSPAVPAIAVRQLFLSFGIQGGFQLFLCYFTHCIFSAPAPALAQFIVTSAVLSTYVNKSAC
ncbi:hypothetical protein C8R43DRAFT_995136 [Mycena crocata]|nr:hypothetical protein C8R43DRAFT_995136 [Mycena crocata]